MFVGLQVEKRLNSEKDGRTLCFMLRNRMSDCTSDVCRKPFWFDVCLAFYRVVLPALMKSETWKFVTEMIINKSSLMCVSIQRWLQFIIIIIIIIAETTLMKNYICVKIL